MSRASELAIMKLLQPKDYGVDSGGYAVKVMALTWGDLASRLKGRRRKAEREVSRGRSSPPPGRKDRTW